jgi:hypothetical protein
LREDVTFGLPVEGAYDDYGGVEHLSHPSGDTLNETTFAATGYYKKWELKQSFGSTATWWRAAHPDTLWALPTCIQPIYYTELCVRLSEVDS